jgi:hypothetical protein
MSEEQCNQWMNRSDEKLARGKYRVEKQQQRLSQLVSVLEHVAFPKSIRRRAAEIISLNLHNDSAISCFNVPRQANYFLTYAIDLLIDDLLRNRSVVLEDHLQRMIRRLVNDVSTHQESFDLGGIRYSREQLSAVIDNVGNLKGLGTGPALSDAELTHAENEMKNDTGRAQNVHRSSVLNAASIMLARMAAKISDADRLTPNQAANAILGEMEAILQQERKDRKANRINVPVNISLRSVERAVNVVKNTTRGDNNWKEDITPQQLLPIVWGYIANHPDSQIRHNLKFTLLERLAEISAEDPCSTGKLQRLIHIPSGIDSGMNIFAEALQIGDSVTHIASVAYEFANEYVDDVVDHMRNEGGVVNALVVNELKLDMFRTRLTQELVALGGLSQNEIDSFVAQNAAGFETERVNVASLIGFTTPLVSVKSPGKDADAFKEMFRNSIESGGGVFEFVSERLHRYSIASSEQKPFLNPSVMTSIVDDILGQLFHGQTQPITLISPSGKPLRISIDHLNTKYDAVYMHLALTVEELDAAGDAIRGKRSVCFTQLGLPFSEKLLTSTYISRAADLYVQHCQLNRANNPDAPAPILSSGGIGRAPTLATYFDISQMISNQRITNRSELRDTLEKYVEEKRAQGNNASFIHSPQQFEELYTALGNLLD